jgi:aspartate/methionine/tyrosine aminotransferase
VPATIPAGGFYLWVPVPGSFGTGPDGAAGWALTEALAIDGGLLVSPGDLYGPDGADHVRVAVVQPMERLEVVAGRLAGRTLAPGAT